MKHGQVKRSTYEQRYGMKEIKGRWRDRCTVCQDWKPSVALGNMLGIESICVVMHKGRLMLSGDVDRLAAESCEKKCIHMNLHGNRGTGHPWKTWDDVLRDNLRVQGLTRDSKRPCSRRVVKW